MNESEIRFQMAVVVPLCQALITAVLVAVMLLVLTMLVTRNTSIQVSPWVVSLLGFCLSGLLTWMSLFGDWRRAQYGELVTVETVQNDEPVPTFEPRTVRVEMVSDGGRAMQRIDLPAREEQLIQLGAGLVEGVSFCESSWVGGGKPFTRGEFVSLRDELINRNLATWNSPRDRARGLSLTRPGRAMMRHFATMTPTPPYSH